MFYSTWYLVWQEISLPTQKRRWNWRAKRLECWLAAGFMGNRLINGSGTRSHQRWLQMRAEHNDLCASPCRSNECQKCENANSESFFITVPVWLILSFIYSLSLVLSHLLSVPPHLLFPSSVWRCLFNEVLTFELLLMDLFSLIDTSFLALFLPVPVWSCEVGGHIWRLAHDLTSARPSVVSTAVKCQTSYVLVCGTLQMLGKRQARFGACVTVSCRTGGVWKSQVTTWKQSKFLTFFPLHFQLKDPEWKPLEPLKEFIRLESQTVILPSHLQSLHGFHGRL